MRILIGSSSAQSIHAVIENATAEMVPWLTGVALIAEAPGRIELSTDADLLGSASVRLESLSLVATANMADNSLGVPTGPVGKRRPFQDRLSISAREVEGALHVDLELPRLVAEEKNAASGSWEEWPPGAHLLMVDTHIMGRAEMHIAYLRFRYV